MNSSRRRNSLDQPILTALTMLFFAGLVFVPTLMQQEPLRWKAANAIVAYEQGDKNVAIESLRNVAAELPEDFYLQTKLLNWLSESGRSGDAIDYCNRQLQQNPGSLEWLELRREAECDAGKFKDAWHTFQELKSSQTQRVSLSPEEFNERAYVRALAEEQLDLAAQDIQHAISATTYRSGVPDFQIPLPSQALVAASLLSRGTETQRIVLPTLNSRIDVVRRALEDREEIVVDLLTEYSGKSFPLTEIQESKLDSIRGKVDLRRRELAFLTVCRALIFEDLAQPDRCDLDRAQIVELGFEPQTVANLLPEDVVCQSLAMRAIAFLDTRGFVLTKMPWSDPDALIDGVSTGRDAIEDLDIAVVVAEVIDDIQKKSVEISDEKRSRFRKTYAAVLQHRAAANQKAGNEFVVRLDRERIEGLGFDADGNLY